MKDAISIRAAVLTSLNGKPSLLSPAFQNQLADLLQDKSVISGTGFQRENKEHMAAFFGGSSNYDYDRSYLYADGLAFIPVQGLLLNRVSFSGWGITGYDYIRGAVNEAMSASDVKGIIFDINSPGGSAQGCFELSEYIASLRGTKPMMGFINANACSGGYAIASAIGNIQAVKSADVGSIGVYSMHMDVSKMFDDFGIKIEFVFAGEHKVDGNAYEPLSAEVRKDMQASVDDTYHQFTALVAANRSIEESAVVATQARVYSAEEAKTLGLIDNVASAEVAVASFRSELSGSVTPTQEVTTMSDPKNPAGNNDAANEQAIKDAQKAAVAAHIQRRKDITSCEEAKGREELAAHLADETDMPVEAVKGILSASPKKTEAKPEGKGSQFEKAMNKGNPDVQDDGSEGDGKGKELTGASRLIAAGQKAGVLRKSK